MNRPRQQTLIFTGIALAALACSEESQTGPGAIAVADDTAVVADSGPASGSDVATSDAGSPGVDTGGASVATPAGSELLAVAPGALHFAVASAQVYWSSPDSQQVLRVGHSGGKVEQVYKEVGINVPEDIAVAGGNVFWAATNPTLYFVRSFNEAAGAKGTVLTAKPELAPQIIQAIQADETHVYFTTGSHDGPNYTGLIRRVELGTGTALNLKSWVQEPTDLALHGGHVYWTTRKGPAVQRIVKNGSQPEVLVKQVMGAQALTVDGTFVWWANQKGLSVDLEKGTIMRAPVQGGPPVTVATEQANPIAMASGTNYIWWVNEGTAEGGYKDGQLVRFERSAKDDPEVVRDGLERPVDLRIALGAAWWLTRGPGDDGIGGIFRLPLAKL